MTKSTDDEIEINLDLDNLVVLLWRSNTPGSVKGMEYKDVDARRISGIGFNGKKTDDKWRAKFIVTGDALGLHWLGKMTGEKRMSEISNIGVVQQSHLRWAEIKLKDMDSRGWKKVAENLAFSSGVKMVTTVCGREYIHMSGSDNEWTIRHNEEDQQIVICRRIKQGQNV